MSEMHWQPFTPNEDDERFSELMRKQRDAIAKVFKIPPSLLGVVVVESTAIVLSDVPVLPQSAQTLEREAHL